MLPADLVMALPLASATDSKTANKTTKKTAPFRCGLFFASTATIITRSLHKKENLLLPEDAAEAAQNVAKAALLLLAAAKQSAEQVA